MCSSSRNPKFSEEHALGPPRWFGALPLNLHPPPKHSPLATPLNVRAILSTTKHNSVSHNYVWSFKGHLHHRFFMVRYGTDKNGTGIQKTTVQMPIYIPQFCPYQMAPNKSWYCKKVL